jgi:hypothetical protein
MSSHVLEKAPTGRAMCRGCGAKIASGEWRFGERLPNPYDEGGGDMTRWFHPACAAFKRPEAFVEMLAAAEPFDDRERLEHEAKLGLEHRRLPRINTAERASTGRATCRHCKEPIAKGEWRISLVYYEDGRFSPSGYLHPACVSAYFETTAIMPRVKHFSPALSESDLAEIEAAVK